MRKYFLVSKQSWEQIHVSAASNTVKKNIRNVSMRRKHDFIGITETTYFLTRTLVLYILYGYDSEAWQELACSLYQMYSTYINRYSCIRNITLNTESFWTKLREMKSLQLLSYRKKEKKPKKQTPTPPPQPPKVLVIWKILEMFKSHKTRYYSWENLITQFYTGEALTKKRNSYVWGRGVVTIEIFYFNKWKKMSGDTFGLINQ